MEQCSGECSLELLDDLLLTRFEDALATSGLSADVQSSARFDFLKIFENSQIFKNF